MKKRSIISKDYFRIGFKAWKRELFHYKYLIMLSLVLVGMAGLIDYSCGRYVSRAQGAHVPDLILDHVAPIDMSILFIYGYLTLVFTLMLYPLVLHIGTLHMVISQFSLLVVLRSLFIIFTHLQPPPDVISVHFPGIFQQLSFQNDMFFSGHTAIPFLGFLLFRKSGIRYFFLVGSIFMGVAVLAMHLHYSIDVFAAFFITWTSYTMGNRVLKWIEPYIKKKLR